MSWSRNKKLGDMNYSQEERETGAKENKGMFLGEKWERKFQSK